jgi:hypothetical protein
VTLSRRKPGTGVTTFYDAVIIGSLVFEENKDGFVAAETEGLGKACDHSTAVLRGRLNLFLFLSPICLR